MHSICEVQSTTRRTFSKYCPQVDRFTAHTISQCPWTVQLQHTFHMLRAPTLEVTNLSASSACPCYCTDSLHCQCSQQCMFHLQIKPHLNSASLSALTALKTHPVYFVHHRRAGAVHCTPLFHSEGAHYNTGALLHSFSVLRVYNLVHQFKITPSSNFCAQYCIVGTTNILRGTLPCRETAEWWNFWIYKTCQTSTLPLG